MNTASVTELKNSLSAYLGKVQRGQRVVVTDHHRPVAILQSIFNHPMPSELLGLAADGLVAMPKGKLDLQSFLSLPKGRSRTSLVSAVSEDRDGR
jgi:prevent-host-death family protein